VIAAITDLIRSAGYLGLFDVVLAENLVPPLDTIVGPLSTAVVAVLALVVLVVLVRLRRRGRAS